MPTTLQQVAYSLSQLTIKKAEIKIKTSRVTAQRINQMIAEIQEGIS